MRGFKLLKRGSTLITTRVSAHQVTVLNLFQACHSAYLLFHVCCFTLILISTGADVMYAVLRRPADDLSSALAPRRARHPLASAFRTLDATSYTEIATVPVDRIVLDLAVRFGAHYRFTS